MKKLSTFLFLLFVLVVANHVEAAVLSPVVEKSTFNLNEEFVLSIILDTENEKINAIGGEISFPSELLVIKEIRDGDSLVNFWLEKPAVKEGNKISFSGIVPGGYQGKNRPVFVVVFQTKKSGIGALQFSNLQALKNDGQGTLSSVVAKAFIFNISNKQADTSVVPVKDKIKPEVFRPEVSTSEFLFEGKSAVFFSAQDKQSGIDHYEVKEVRHRIIGWSVKWLVADSPYILLDQKLNSFVYVKAIDRAGNYRVAKVPPLNPPIWYENSDIWIIIILIILLFWGYKKYGPKK